MKVAGKLSMICFPGKVPGVELGKGDVACLIF